MKEDLTKEQKRKLFDPKKWGLYCNGDLVRICDSHSEAKKAKYFGNKEANENWLDETYTIKRI